MEEVEQVPTADASVEAAAAVADVALGSQFGKYGGWARVPPAAASAGVLVQFEAAGLEDLRVGFAPVGATQWLYEVAIGTNGNTEVVWRKCVGRQREADLARVFAGRTCATPDFVRYWVAVAPSGALAMGIDRELVAKTVDPKFEAPEDGFQVAFTTWKAGGTFRNISITALPDDVQALIDVGGKEVPRVLVRGDPWGKEELVQPAQREEYVREWEASRKRADRFGGDFTAPDVKKYLDSKAVRQLQRTGAIEPGFATGIDLMSEQEAKKREDRMKRFNTPQFALEFSTETARALENGMTQEEWDEKQRDQQKLRERAQKFGLSAQEDRSQTANSLVPASAKVGRERCDIKPESLLEVRDDAIHMYSLDERFQQVRTSDVMAYFYGYGPSYVEWINDSSCTVVFRDSFTSGRALIALAQPIPEQFVKVPGKKSEGADSNAPVSGGDDVEMGDAEAPSTDATESNGAQEQSMEVEVEEQEIPDDAFNRSNWRFGVPIGSSTQSSEKKWRVLIRKATIDDFPAEKEPKKYHARWSGSSSDQRRRNSSRSHPYERSSNRRNNDRESDRDRGQGRSRGRRGGERSTGKPSNRFKVNEDGSINLVRDRPSAPSEGESSSAPIVSSDVPATSNDTSAPA